MIALGLEYWIFKLTNAVVRCPPKMLLLSTRTSNHNMNPRKGEYGDEELENQYSINPTAGWRLLAEYTLHLFPKDNTVLESNSFVSGGLCVSCSTALFEVVRVSRAYSIPDRKQGEEPSCVKYGEDWLLVPKKRNLHEAPSDNWHRTKSSSTVQRQHEVQFQCAVSWSSVIELEQKTTSFEVFEDVEPTTRLEYRKEFTSCQGFTWLEQILAHFRWWCSFAIRCAPIFKPRISLQQHFLTSGPAHHPTDTMTKRTKKVGVTGKFGTR